MIVAADRGQPPFELGVREDQPRPATPGVSAVQRRTEADVEVDGEGSSAEATARSDDAPGPRPSPRRGRSRSCPVSALVAGVKMGSIRSPSRKPARQDVRRRPCRGTRGIHANHCPREIAPDDALEGDDLGFVDDHRPRPTSSDAQIVSARGRPAVVDVGRDPVVGIVPDFVDPPRGSGPSGCGPCRGSPSRQEPNRYALMRSVATIRRRPSPRSYTSRTLPRRLGRPGEVRFEQGHGSRAPERAT